MAGSRSRPRAAPAEPPGEHHAGTAVADRAGVVVVGDLDGRAEQRVPGGASAERLGVDGGGLGFGPVPLVLEGVRGQVGADRGGRSAEEGGPVDVRTADVQFGERCEDGGLLGAVLAQGGDTAPVVRAENAEGEGGQAAAGADFQEGPSSLVAQRGDRVGEPYGVAHLVDPVLRGGEAAVLSEGTGERGDDLDSGRPRVQPGDDGAKLVEHGCHQRRVEGMADRQSLGLPALVGQSRRHGQDGVLGTGEHDGVGSVDRGDRDLARGPGQQRRHLGLGRLYGDHRAALGQCLHQPAAGGDQFARLRQVEDPGGVGG